MRVSIARGIAGSEMDRALPKRYAGVADAATRRRPRLTLLSFPDNHVVTSSDAARALGRVSETADEVVAFMSDGTAEALAALREAGARVFQLRSFGWTDEQYASIRQPRSHERDRDPGGRPR